MPRSIRLDPELEQRLKDVAEQEGVTVSAAAREAIREYCDKKKPITLYEALKDYIGAFEGPGNQADRAHEAFGEALLEKRARDSR
jgi:hypothetical protein